MMLIRKEHVILVAGKPSYLAVCFPDVSQIGVPLPADISPQPCLGPVTTTIQLVFLSQDQYCKNYLHSDKFLHFNSNTFISCY